MGTSNRQITMQMLGRLSNRLARPAAASAALFFAASPVHARASSAEDILSSAKDLNNVKRANNLYREAADLGNAEAKYLLAQNLINGFGVTKDVDAGVALLTQASEAGHPQAQYNLAVLYKIGRGVPKNDKKANQLLEMAANNGSAEALGAMNGQLYMKSKNNQDVTDAMINKVIDATKKFDQMDVDGDGKITRQEWIAHFGSDVGYSDYDSDSDGYISRTEFVAGTIRA